MEKWLNVIFVGQYTIGQNLAQTCAEMRQKSKSKQTLL